MENEYILDYSRVVLTKNNQPTNQQSDKKKHNKKILFSEYFYKYDLDYQKCWHQENEVIIIHTLNDCTYSYLGIGTVGQSNVS